MTHEMYSPNHGYGGLRYEVIPLRGALAAARELPSSSTVTVTSTPAKGLDATVDLAQRLQLAGYHAVPHLAARLLTSHAHLDEVLEQLAECDIEEVFVVGGDSPSPAGEFSEALPVLRAISEHRYRPQWIGIGGYPERHAVIPDNATSTALDEKSRYADYIVSQICYDANTIATWVKSLRARGVDLPVYVGAPGSVDMRKLLRISMKIGLGESMRYLRKQHNVGKVVTGYAPTELFHELSPMLTDPEYNIAGWHLYTFNEVAKTRRWLENMGYAYTGTSQEDTA